MTTTFKAILVTNPETGEQFSYVPGDDIPEDQLDWIDPSAQEIIFTNPDEAEEEVFTDGNANSELVGSPPPAGSGAAGDYRSMRVPELRREAARREVGLTGLRSKDEIIAALEAADAREEEE